MRAHQALWTEQRGWSGPSEGPADLVLAFGGTRAMTNHELWSGVRGAASRSHRAGLQHGR
jgi:hypothetical protein